MILKAVVGPELAGTRLDDGAKTLFPQFSKARTVFRVLSAGGGGRFWRRGPSAAAPTRSACTSRTAVSR